MILRITETYRDGDFDVANNYYTHTDHADRFFADGRLRLKAGTRLGIEIFNTWGDATAKTGPVEPAVEPRDVAILKAMFHQSEDERIKVAKAKESINQDANRDAIWDSLAHLGLVRLIREAAGAGK